MKLPVIRHFQKNNDAEALEKAVSVLESFTEYRSVTDQEIGRAHV